MSALGAALRRTSWSKVTEDAPTREQLLPLIAAAVIYFVMFWPFVRLVSRLQNKTVTA